ncbi:MAG TPA: SDR family NAD(P)-dependent oxidoreductase [Salinimicrobium sp.]|nr:SDR family NAD(P)-dependent oxidoreductase [Salinimicrobium sp.]
MELNSKTAIVTGASRGLGKATASTLLAKGVKVYGIARNKKDLMAVQKELGENFFPVVQDIGNEGEIKKWIAATFSENNAPDILINNAGAGIFGKIDELSSEQWHQMINTNLNAAFYLTSAIVPFMKKSKNSSHIINIGSILGKISGAEKSGYSATKFGIQGFSEALFKELRYDSIKVSCVNPGSIETNFFEDSGVESHDKMLHPEDIAATLVHILETPDNVLINDLTIRPLNPKTLE